MKPTTIQYHTRFSASEAAEQMPSHRCQRRRQGASLIEIMVVMVVLLLGLFLAIRVFPLGFGVIRQSGNRTLATQLAEQQLGQIKGDVIGAPQGVLFGYINQSTGGFEYLTQVDPDNLKQYDADGNPATIPDPDPYWSDINKFRMVKGEAVKIPPPLPTAFGSGSRYICKFGPLLINNAQVQDPNNAPDPNNAAQVTLFNSFLNVYSAPLRGINVESPGEGPDPNAIGRIRNQLTYLIDYGDDGTQAYIYLPPRNTGITRTFTVTISYNRGNDIVTRTCDALIDNPNQPAWQALKVGNVPVTDAVPGSETVVRNFTRIARGAAWDLTDPYQYKLHSENIRVGDVAANQTPNTVANLGVIAFNPIGANYSEQGTNVQQPFTAYLDYAVLDWHIIRDDREVPSVLTGLKNTIAVRTTIPRIKRVGEPETDFGFYTGVFGNTTAPNAAFNPKDLVVFDLDDPTGQPLLAGNYNNGAVDAGDPPNVGYYIVREGTGSTYATGSIFINANRIPPGRKIRILYKAIGDWGVAFQRAYAQYQPGYRQNSLTAIAPYPLRGGFNRYAQSGAGATAELRFPLADRGKTVVVSLQYRRPTGEIRRLAPIQMVIEGQATAVGNVNTGYYDRIYSYIPVRKYLPFNLQGEFNQATTWGVVGDVQGVSLKARVIWHDNDAPNERWRVQDLDTYASPAAVR